MPPKKRSQSQRREPCRNAHGRYMTCPISLERYDITDGVVPNEAILTPNGKQVYRRHDLMRHLKRHNWWPHTGAGGVVVNDDTRRKLVRAQRNNDARREDERVRQMHLDKSLHDAIRNGKSVADVQRTIDSGAGVNGTGYATTRTPLMKAAVHDRPDIGRILLGSGRVRINATDIRGQTALHLAAKVLHMDFVKLLIEFGADVKIKDSEKMTARQYAKDKLRGLPRDDPRRKQYTELFTKYRKK